MAELGPRPREDALTDRDYWDRYWSRVRLPLEIVHGRPWGYGSQILGVFDRYLGDGSSKSALAIGGAPGQYLAYVAKAPHYSVACLDNSDVGCEKTRENLRLLGLHGAARLAIHERVSDRGVSKARRRRDVRDGLTQFAGGAAG